MSVHQANWNPTDRQLRQFGVISMLALPTLAWLFSGRPGPAGWTSFHATLVGGLAAFGVFLAGLGWIRPQAIKPVFIALTLAVFPIGLVVSEVLVFVIYAIVMTPVAIVFRLIGRDALERKIDRQATTYWTPKKQPQDVKSYYRQS